MKNSEIISELNHARRIIKEIENDIVRRDGMETIDSVIKEINMRQEPGNPSLELSEDYKKTRDFIIRERRMREIVFAKRSREFLKSKLDDCDNAGISLGRLAKALGMKVPKSIETKATETQGKLWDES